MGFRLVLIISIEFLSGYILPKTVFNGIIAFDAERNGVEYIFSGWFKVDVLAFDDIFYFPLIEHVGCFMEL